ncbi:MAG: sugar phosphate isomerase/epimerase [Clostridia bacterium]|nr:sugar phosphate isomerase/epimerase [Clostridia bacterium]
MLKVGMVTRSLFGFSVEDCAAKLAEFGFTSTEFCFTFPEMNLWLYNGAADMSPVTDEWAENAAKIFRDKGIELVSVGAFTNPNEADPDKFNDVCNCFEGYCRIARAMGIPYVSTETGFVPGKRGINTDTYEADFRRFADNMGKLCDIAEKYGVSIAFEPCMLDVTPSAKRTRDFIEFVGKPNLKVLLDPANLIHNSDEKDMFRYLAPHLAYIHGKDRLITDTYGRNVGEGIIDWVEFFKLYHTYAEGVPFILEYVNAENCCSVRDLCLEFNERAEAEL